MFNRPLPVPAERASSASSLRVQLRQGDVLLAAVESIPPDSSPEPRAGRIVLAEGEATGHAHAIEEADARTFTHGSQRFLLVRSRAQLIHEEHAPIEVPAGNWRIVIQREYQPGPVMSEAWRRVVD